MGKKLEEYLLQGDEGESHVAAEDLPQETREDIVEVPSEPAGTEPGLELGNPNSPVIGVAATEVRALMSATLAKTSRDDLDEYLWMYEYLGDPEILPQGLDEGIPSTFPLNS
ncbi:hypothetical protein GUJ93_ZPchr0011g28003 [Zizania palustris]|uniref:Uncharacterized protein n=1 Tax=Zizania palustris TaxID=103762 RepID=A0A8J6BP21_ZIZPA|nr:hypothetical protein GUJ93_ZPchr0011g28003 [Zizania palustris]